MNAAEFIDAVLEAANVGVDLDTLLCGYDPENGGSPELERLRALQVAVATGRGNPVAHRIANVCTLDERELPESEPTTVWIAADQAEINGERYAPRGAWVG